MPQKAVSTPKSGFETAFRGVKPLFGELLLHNLLFGDENGGRLPDVQSFHML